MGLLWSLVLHIFYALPLYMIAQKSGHEYAWLAFIPLANFWLMCDLADVSILWAILFLFFFPLFPFFYIYLWMRIAESTNKSPLWGILMIVPVISTAVAYYLAFYEPDQARY